MAKGRLRWCYQSLAAPLVQRALEGCFIRLMDFDLAGRALSRPDGRTYEALSGPSLNLQAKGSECSLAIKRRVAEQKSPEKCQNVRVRNSCSKPRVCSPSIERETKCFTTHYSGAARLFHSRLLGGETALFSTPADDFGRVTNARF